MPRHVPTQTVPVGERERGRGGGRVREVRERKEEEKERRGREERYLRNSISPMRSVADVLLTFHSPHRSPLNRASWN